jgi:hypothetical protein
VYDLGEIILMVRWEDGVFCTYWILGGDQMTGAWEEGRCEWFGEAHPRDEPIRALDNAGYAGQKTEKCRELSKRK